MVLCVSFPGPLADQEIQPGQQTAAVGVFFPSLTFLASQVIWVLVSESRI